MRCPNCHGTGEIPIPTPTGVVRNRCEICGGTGNIPETAENIAFAGQLHRSRARARGCFWLVVLALIALILMLLVIGGLIIKSQ